LIKFQISLSQPPTASTIAHAEHFLIEERNPRPPTQTLTWKDILAEEPFEGEHWEGILNTKSVDEQGWDSTPSLSPFSSDFEDASPMLSLSYDGRRRRQGSHQKVSEQYENSHQKVSEQYENEDIPAVEKVIPGSNVCPYTHVHRREYEDLLQMQYWRSDWKGYYQPSKQFDIGDPSTLGK